MTADRAVVWSATDRPARLLVEYAATDQFQNARRILGPAALPESGYTAKVVLDGLPAGQDVFYRVTFLDLGRHEDDQRARRGAPSHGAGGRP